MKNNHIPRIVQAVPGEQYTVYCYFDDGKITVMDMAPFVGSGVFAPLADPGVFSGALTVLGGTVAWDLSGRRDPADCIDIDPVTLYEQPAASDPLGGAAIA